MIRFHSNLIMSINLYINPLNHLDLIGSKCPNIVDKKIWSKLSSYWQIIMPIHHTDQDLTKLLSWDVLLFRSIFLS